MISLVESCVLPAPPARVWAVFREMDRHYAAWHPEHLTWRWLRGEPLTTRAVWFADEWIGAMRVHGRFFVVAADPERGFAYRTGFPGAALRAGGSFRLAPAAGDGCRLTQEVHLGLPRFLAGTAPVRELRRHMREEQANLPALL